MAFKFPANAFDNPTRLLSTLGSFWLNTYDGRVPVAAILYARAQLEAQNHLDLLDLVSAMSRYTVPIFRKENWFLLQITESERNTTSANFAQFDGTYLFDGTLSWGVPLRSSLSTWNAPVNLKEVKVALNRITESSLTLVHGVDFVLDTETGTVTFRDNPFDNPLVAVREIVEDNEIMDREAALWLYCGKFDLETVYQQFGYALGIHLESSEGYRDLINAIFDCLVDGSTQLSVDKLFAAVAGVSLIKTQDELVQHVLLDDRHLWVITDKNAYRHHRRADCLVGVGDTLYLGESITDALVIYEFGKGQVPDDLHVLSVPAGHLATGYFHDVAFENKTVSLIVEENVDGFTKVSFEIAGFPGDTEKFWDDVHAKGVLAGETLAMLLDQRPEDARDTQPTAMALPGAVNPLGFLLQNVFRNNLWVVKLKPSVFGPGALGLHNLTALRKIIPPHTAVMVVVELAIADDPVILEAPGDEDSPGYEESLASFSGGLYQESLDYTLIAESLKGRQLAGRCI